MQTALARTLPVLAVSFLFGGETEAIPWTEHVITSHRSLGRFDLVVLDIDGDGRLDIASRSQYYGDAALAFWRKNDGVGGSAGGGSLGSYKSTRMLFADLDGDGDPDRLGTGSQSEWFENTGGSDFVSHPGFGSGLQWAGPVDADGLVDLVFVDSENVTWRRGTGNLGFAPPMLLFSGVTGEIMAGDFSGDGRTDFLASLKASGVGVFLQATDGSYSQQSTLPAMSKLDGRHSAADIDNDSDTDVFGNGLWLNNGTGFFSVAPTTVPFGAPADVDGDGRLDIVPIASSSWIRQQADGTFTEPGNTTYRTSSGGGFDVATGDLDGDGDVDIVGNHSAYGVLSWYENPLLSPLTFLISDWRQHHFGVRDNTGLAADFADPDGDGVNNRLEYTFDLDPHDPSGANGPAGLPTVESSEGGARFLLTLPAPARLDLKLTVEFKNPGIGDSWIVIATRAGRGAWLPGHEGQTWAFVSSQFAGARETLRFSAGWLNGKEGMWRLRVDHSP